jgi:hypothetical protein
VPVDFITLALFSINYGEFHNQGDGNFLVKMLPSIVGSLIGVGGSLILYYKKTKDDKINDDAKALAEKTKIETNTLNYFIALVKSVLKISVQQADHYKAHADNLTNKPFEHHFLTTVIAEDINRVLHELEHERIFHSYLGKFGNDTARIEKFQKIFSRLDYIEAVYKDLLKIEEKLEEELLNKKIKYKELAEEDIRNFCGRLANAIKHSDPQYQQNPFYNLLNSSILSYHNNKPNPETLEYLQSGFIEPVKVAIVRQFMNIPEAVHIADTCRKATWLYSEIKMRSETLGKDFYRGETELKKVSEELKDLTSDLIK